MALDFQAIVKTTPNEFVLTFNLKFSSFLEFWQDWTKMQNAGHRHKFREQLLAQSLVRVLVTKLCHVSSLNVPPTLNNFILLTMYVERGL